MSNQASNPNAEMVDGVIRHSRSGIRVIIVGAGVGGLMAGLECWRKGHEVQILERSESLSVLGDGFTISPSGITSLQYYPRMRARYNEHVYNSTISVYSFAGDKYMQTEPGWVSSKHPAGDQPVSFISSRPELAGMMLEQAKRLGIPVFWGRKVDRYEEDIRSGEARVRTESGEIFTGDVVVAADGIGTKSHAVVTGSPVKAESSGYAVVRCAFPATAIAPGSAAAALIPKVGERPDFRVHVTENAHLILMLQPDWIGIAYTHKDRGVTKDSWHNTMSKESLIAELNDYETLDPAIVDMLNQIPIENQIVDWKLSWRDPRPQWVSPGGRVVQLGDAAHTFLPSSGNGATQALEDAVSLAECLRRGGQVKLPWSTSVHQLLRFERVSLIQKYGIESRERMHHIAGPMGQMFASGKLPSDLNIPLFQECMWAHNPEEYAAKHFEAGLNHVQFGCEFRNTNTNMSEGQKYEAWTPTQVVQAISEARERGDWMPIPAALTKDTATVVTAAA